MFAGTTSSLLKELPISTVGKIGWPWQEGRTFGAPGGHGVKSWPRISIVTPNYNGAQSLEETIRSVLLQKYPNLEYLIIDGGSTDGSIEIIKKYAPWITYWASEKDRGQAHAINKGFMRCTGEIVNWLCSDDILLPGALFRVAIEFVKNPEIDVLAGQGCVIFEQENREMIGGTTLEMVNLIPLNNSICQPACFYRRKLLLYRQHPLDESYNYAMDFELWAFFKSQRADWKVIGDVLCRTLMSGENKCSTGGMQITKEQIRVYKRYVRERIPLTFWYRILRLPLERFRLKHPGRMAYYIARPLQIAAVLALGPFYGFRRVRTMNYSMGLLAKK
jgi:glycosyltransferase involved in cell wall biosynthesis